MNTLSAAGMQSNPDLKMDDGGFNNALDRFNAQTQELKRLLADDEVEGGQVVSDSEGGDTDEESGSRSEDEEESDSGSEEESDSECDSSDYSDNSSDWDSDLEDLEAVLQGGAPPPEKKPISKTNSSPALMAMDISMQNEVDNVLPGMLDLKERMRRTSTSYLQSPEYTTETQPETLDNPFASTKPDDHLKSVLEGFSAASFPSETWHDYFLKMTDEHIAAHTTEVEQAIRNEDYAVLRSMMRQGHTLQTCNRHGESTVHIACRRGTLELVQFLLHEAGVTTQIRDDMGRTPLHDVCWTHDPNFDVVMELLKVSPELLFIVDHRGATPLTYVPREAWGVWCEFLQEHRQFLRDMVKTLRFDRARYYVKNMVPCLKF